MTERKRDPLLTAAKVVVMIANALSAFAGVMVVIAIIALLTGGRSELTAELVKAGMPPSGYWAVIGALAIVAVLLALLAVFLQFLYNIVRSVDQGNAFDPANARLLAKMGWLSVAGHLLSVPLGAIAAWVSQYDVSEDGFDIDVGFGPGGLVLTLVLFVLARVFRQGAAMREDLEGTV